MHIRINRQRDRDPHRGVIKHHLYGVIQRVQTIGARGGLIKKKYEIVRLEVPARGQLLGGLASTTCIMMQWLLATPVV